MFQRIQFDRTTLDKLIELKMLDVSTLHDGEWVPTKDRSELYRAAINGLIESATMEGFEVTTNGGIPMGDVEVGENSYDDDDYEHWSSPNGCHPDCPACAAE